MRSLVAARAGGRLTRVVCLEGVAEEVQATAREEAVEVRPVLEEEGLTGWAHPVL